MMKVRVMRLVAHYLRLLERNRIRRKGATSGGTPEQHLPHALATPRRLSLRTSSVAQDARVRYAGVGVSGFVGQGRQRSQRSQRSLYTA